MKLPYIIHWWKIGAPVYMRPSAWVCGPGHRPQMTIHFEPVVYDRVGKFQLVSRCILVENMWPKEPPEAYSKHESTSSKE